MPLGGIYPILSHSVGELLCYSCGRTDGKIDHFCLDWDAYFHSECVFVYFGKPEIKKISDIWIRLPDGKVTKVFLTE